MAKAKKITETKSDTAEMVTYEYGAMSSRFSLQATNKLTAYSTMCLHYKESPHLIAIYEPEANGVDSWLSFDGNISDKLDEVFGGDGAFYNYIKSNMDVIRVCYKTIKRIE